MRLRQLAANLTRLDVNNDVTLWFSYETPLAIRAPGVGLVVNADCAAYSRTSAKHLGQLGFGAAASDRPRIPSARFVRLVDHALALDFRADTWERSAARLAELYRDDADVTRAVA